MIAWSTIFSRRVNKFIHTPLKMLSSVDSKDPMHVLQKFCYGNGCTSLLKYRTSPYTNMMSGTHLCKLRTFIYFFTTPWIKHLIEYSYLPPSDSVKISWGKKMGIFFLFHILWKGHFTCKSMEIGIFEGTITLILKHYKAQFHL